MKIFSLPLHLLMIGLLPLGCMAGPNYAWHMTNLGSGQFEQLSSITCDGCGMAGITISAQAFTFDSGFGLTASQVALTNGYGLGGCNPDDPDNCFGASRGIQATSSGLPSEGLLILFSSPVRLPRLQLSSALNRAQGGGTFVDAQFWINRPVTPGETTLDSLGEAHYSSATSLVCLNCMSGVPRSITTQFSDEEVTSIFMATGFGNTKESFNLASVQAEASPTAVAEPFSASLTLGGLCFAATLAKRQQRRRNRRAEPYSYLNA